MSPLVPLKTGYESAALILGSAILQQAVGFERVRRELRDQDEAFAHDGGPTTSVEARCVSTFAVAPDVIDGSEAKSRSSRR
jgi:hypothetical protein